MVPMKGLVGAAFLSAASCAAPPAVAPAPATSSFTTVRNDPRGAPWPLSKGQTPAVSIAVGHWWACALLADGTVWCWGENGPAPDTARQVPIEHVGALEVAGEAAYALTEAGALVTWGQNAGDALPRTLEPGGVAEIAAGDGYACLRKQTGEVECWEPENSAPRIRVPLAPAVRIAVGPRGGCAVGAADGVWCWDRAAARPAPVARPEARKAKEVAVGSAIGCALFEGGRVQCWGDAETARRAEVLFAGAQRLRAGAGSLCALSDLKSPACFFASEPPRTEKADATPLSAAEFRGVTDVRSDLDIACAIRDGAIRCWGAPPFWRWLPPDTSQSTVIPIDLGNLDALRRVRAVAVGDDKYGVGDNKCVITTDDELDCWGLNAWGELGVGDTATRLGPTPVPGVGPVRAVAVGEAALCAVTRAGDVMCAGRVPFASGSCGDDSGEGVGCETTPVRVGSDAVEVAVGDKHVCWIDHDGHARCMGENDHGELGDGTREARRTPVLVLDADRRPLSDLASITAVGGHTCAVDRRHRLWCWGENAPSAQGRPYNSAGRVLLASAPFSLGPVAEIGRSCVRLEGGEVRCWGDLTGLHRIAYEPVRVGVCGVRRLAGGPGFCTVTGDGTVSCADFEYEFVGFSAHLDHVTAIAGGQGDVCAVDGSGRLACWRDGYAEEPRSEIGIVVPIALQAPAPAGCPVDPPARALPRFPPEPYDRVRVRQLDPESAALRELTSGQARRLVALVNDRTNFVPVSLAGESESDHHVYEFVNRDGETLAEIRVAHGCTDIDVTPDSPAHHVVVGTVLEPKMTKALVALCQELGLTGCEGE